MNHPRYYSTLEFFNNTLYIIGGKTKGSIATPTCERLDLTKPDAKWEDLPPMSKPRFGHLAWTSNNKIYVVGGTTVDKGKPLSEVEVFDIAANKWSIHSNLS